MSLASSSPYNPNGFDRAMDAISYQLEGIERSLSEGRIIPPDFPTELVNLRHELAALHQQLNDSGAWRGSARRRYDENLRRLQAIEHTGSEIARNLDGFARQVEAARQQVEQTRRQHQHAERAMAQAHLDLDARQQELIASLEQDAALRRRIIALRRRAAVEASNRIDRAIRDNVARAQNTTRKRRRLLISAGAVLLLVAAASLLFVYVRALYLGADNDFTTSLLLNVGTESLITGALLLILELVFSLWEGQKDSVETNLILMQWQVEQTRLDIEVDEAALHAIEAELAGSREGISSA